MQVGDIDIPAQPASDRPFRLCGIEWRGLFLDTLKLTTRSTKFSKFTFAGVSDKIPYPVKTETLRPSDVLLV